MRDRDGGRRAPDGASGEAIDRLAVPLVSIDEVGRVRRANPAARFLVDEVHGLAATPGAALCTHRFEQGLLMSATAAASRPAARRLGRLTVRRDEERPVDLLVARLAAAEASVGAFVVLLVDPRSATTPATVLARGHGLNRRETRVVARILEGSGGVASGRSFGGSRGSARSALGGVFAKLGTTRQVDLVRLLLAGVLELRA